MSAYAEIVDGFCVNVIEADTYFAEIYGLISIPDGYWTGDYYDGKTWHHGKPPTEEERLAALESAMLSMMGVNTNV